MINKNKVIIFDGDDTLWRTQELYDFAKAEFKKLIKRQGLYEKNVIELLDELDSKRVEIAKFSKTRFFESMMITYAHLCGKNNKNWDIHIESKIRDLGFSIFRPPQLYDDVMPTLKIFSKKFNLVLFTCGDKTVQNEKLKSLGKKFKSYFSKIYIYEVKTIQEFKDIIDDLKIFTEKIWVVGNSIKSDINPARRLGLKAIFIPRKTWKYEESKLFPGDVLVAHSLKEVANTIMGKKFKK